MAFEAALEAALESLEKKHAAALKLRAGAREKLEAAAQPFDELAVVEAVAPGAARPALRLASTPSEAGALTAAGLATENVEARARTSANKRH